MCWFFVHKRGRWHSDVKTFVLTLNKNYTTNIFLFLYCHQINHPWSRFSRTTPKCVHLRTHERTTSCQAHHVTLYNRDAYFMHIDYGGFCSISTIPSRRHLRGLANHMTKLGKIYSIQMRIRVRMRVFRQVRLLRANISRRPVISTICH